ncbi:FAFR364Cp [Eremothecium gossypii FDAG1]|nr:FAFR364Cp [Eremothecium gossypii FDAG1]
MRAFPGLYDEQLATRGEDWLVHHTPSGSRSLMAMVVSTVFLLCAILWLIYRLVRFLNIPISTIVNCLNPAISHVPQVLIERLGTDTIVFRWENQLAAGAQPCPLSHYAVFLNGRKVGDFPNNSRALYTYCAFRNLLPGCPYRLDILMVRRDGFVDDGKTLHLRTLPPDAGGVRDSVEAGGLPAAGNGAKPVRSAKRLGNRTRTHSMPVPEKHNDEMALASYSFFHSLQDLEEFSIDELKEVLLRTHQELQDFLKHVSATMNGFKMTKTQLLGELDTLKSQWNHNTDVRKTLKTKLKTLENTKAVYELKRDRLLKTIEASSNKLNKMHMDMDMWSSEQNNALHMDTLRQNYNLEKEHINTQIAATTSRLQSMQHELNQLEEQNKRLNRLKKTLDTTKDSVHNTASPVSWRSMSHSVSEQMISHFEAFCDESNGSLSELPQQLPIVQLLRDELEKDIALYEECNENKLQAYKHLEYLETMWEQVSMTNQQYRTAITRQQYPIVNSQPLDNSNLINSPSIIHVDLAPQLMLHDPSTYSESDCSSPLLTQQIPNTYRLPSTLYPGWAQQQHPVQRATPQPYTPDDEVPMEYDHASHLLSGLQSIISEADDSNKNTSKSKLFTTDQLDNYWVQASHPSKKGDSPHVGNGALRISNAKQMAPPEVTITRSASPDILSVAPQYPSKSRVPLSGTSRSLLATLNQYLPATEPNNGLPLLSVQRNDDENIYFNHGIPYGSLSSSPLTIPTGAVSSPDSAFYSPNFNIWHNLDPSDSDTLRKGPSEATDGNPGPAHGKSYPLTPSEG